MFLAKQIDWVKTKLDSTFVRNLGWLGISKLIIRVSRLAATIALARYLSRYDFGLAALVLTVYDFTQIFTRFGIGSKLIQADEADLDELCEGAYSLNWVIFSGLFIAQCIAAFPVSHFYHDPHLVLPICVLAIVYLISPWGRIQETLIQRENRLKVTALANALQLSIANILTVVLAYFLAIRGFGLWAIVLPKVLSTPVSAIIALRYHSWRPSGKFTTKRWGEIFNFGWNILLISVLGTLRNNLDYLLVGRFLGLKALGLYYFAFNSGLGISLEIVQMISTALYPYICEAREEWSRFRKRYFKSLAVVGLIMTPIILLQTTLAPFYVPLVFGREWVPGIPVLILICSCAIPSALVMVVSSLLTAVDKPHLAMYWNMGFTALFASGLFIGIHWGIVGVAASVLISNLVFAPTFTLWATWYVFGKNKSIAQIGG
ncbi:MAG: lipopolysaccharide biosynthesis protein [Scytolyngbya sp. HA4215-MV1]|jgi:PST family polysaccharide transporter|nr:lipopolysaccharide biosynthesis protein [Scytolyngbya sp. HA4215-MV1]